MPLPKKKSAPKSTNQCTMLQVADFPFPSVAQVAFIHHQINTTGQMAVQNVSHLEETWP